MKTSSNPSRTGFSLIELVVTMTLLAILIGVVSLRSGGVAEESRVAKIVSLIDTLKGACAMYHADTGQLAHEYTNYAESHRDLSAQQAADEWGGPYLDGPLSNYQSNPFGGLHVYDNPKVNGWIPGFDVDGDGAVDVATAANMLWLDNIEEEYAARIDGAFDGSVAGEWSETGMVRWSPSDKHCYVLLHR
jgi:prepilin-type N-terminal cleavage/methylation domain-containing protein